MNNELPSWNDSSTRNAILNFVKKVSTAGSQGFVPPEERVAVFDNDGTLWCEKPFVQAGFILEKLSAMAEKDPSLRETQPWKSAYQKDNSFIYEVIEKHYHGDDSLVKILLAGILKSFSDITLEEFNDEVIAYFKNALHPKYKRSYFETTYQPMVELLRYLEANGFTTLIVSGGGRDFVRAISRQVYGVPPERVVGSSPALVFRNDENGANLWRTAGVDILDDGPGKPIHIWNRIGRRPILAAGNSNGDIPMLQFTEGSDRMSLCLMIDHDDAEREERYNAGAEDGIRMSKERNWTVVSMKQDWRNIFSFELIYEK